MILFSVTLRDPMQKERSRFTLMFGAASNRLTSLSTRPSDCLSLVIKLRQRRAAKEKLEIVAKSAADDVTYGSRFSPQEEAHDGLEFLSFDGFVDAHLTDNVGDEVVDGVVGPL